jgi:hypothetical protein
VTIMDMDDMDEHEYASRERSADLLARTAPTEEELAEQAERSRRNRKAEARITWDPSNPRRLTPGRMNQNEYDAWHAAGCPSLELGATTLPPTVGERTSGAPGTEIAVLERRSTAFARSTSAGLDALSKHLTRLHEEVAELRREFDLQQELEAQRNSRRVEALEIALLAAGRNPAEVGAEADLPDFRQWPRHAN